MTGPRYMAAASVCLAGALAFGDERARALDADQARAVLDRAIVFLLQDQNSDGSWGGPRGAVYTFTGAVWSNPETHRSWKVATTGLCCLALLDAPRSDQTLQAVDRALDYLIRNAAVKRPNEWDTMNSWAYLYGLQALAIAHVDPRYKSTPLGEQCHDICEVLLKKLADCQAVNGGWGYLEFDQPRTPRQQWSTSFTTAAAIVAMLDAKSVGIEVDDAVVERGMRAVAHCRLPSGAYTYSVPVIPDPRTSEWIDNIKGSLGRIQVCNLALLMGGREVSEQRLTTGLNQLFRHHRFLDIARNKPIPHETFYYNSGYFYLFGHYYAARVVQQLPFEQRKKYWPRLRYEVAKLQQSDGSMWDYDMHAYHKPYGVAYGVLTLAASLEQQHSAPRHDLPEVGETPDTIGSGDD